MKQAEVKAVDPGSVEAAKAEVERLFELECEWTARRVAAGAAVTTTQLDAGASVLDGGDLDALALASGVAQGRVAIADAAIVEVRQRRAAAIRVVWAAEAAALRLRAAGLRAEANERQRTTDQHLAALLAFEGVRYVPDNRIPELPSTVASDTPWIRLIPTPKTVLLRQEAANCEHAAQQREAQTVSDRGAVEGFSREEILTALDAHGPMALAPARHLVLQWLDTAEAQDRSRRQREEDDRPGHYQLIWSGGTIDARSHLTRPSDY